MSIRIDKEFESLIPPLSDDEFRNREREVQALISVETLDDAIAIMSALNQAKKSARADRMQKGYLVRGGTNEKGSKENNFSSRHAGGHGADSDGRKSNIVASEPGCTDVLRN